MNSPASMRSSKRCCRRISWAERTGLAPSPASLPMVSMAWVYMVVPRWNRVKKRSAWPLVEHASGLAGLRALDGVGVEHAHRGGDAHQRLDAVLHPLRDLGALAVGDAAQRGLQLAVHLHG